MKTVHHIFSYLRNLADQALWNVKSCNGGNVQFINVYRKQPSKIAGINMT